MTAKRRRGVIRFVVGAAVVVAVVAAVALLSDPSRRSGVPTGDSPPRPPAASSRPATPSTPSTPSDPSGGNAVGTRPADPALQWGDGSYLDGNRYLRGVNVYSLISAGYRPDLSSIGEPQSSYDFLASRGVSIVRLAVPWQRLQEIPPGGTALDGLAQPVSAAYLDAVAEQVRRAAAAGIRTVIDLHNGCTYPWGAGDFVAGSVRCGDGIAEADVTRIWSALAERFRGDERVVAYDIFNEPRWSVGMTEYLRFSQVATDAIRATGDEHTLWVEGMLSDTRGRLAALAPDGPWIVDPLGKVVYSEHFYADTREYSPDGVDTPLARLTTFGEWCRTWGVRCAVGEVGWPASADPETARQWNDDFTRFYDLADEYGMDVTYFAANGASDTGSLLAYVASEPGVPTASGIDTALSQAAVIEAHATR